MLTARLRFTGLGILLLVIGLLLAWLRLSHALFAVVTAGLVVILGLIAAGWDTWRQTDQDALEARGIDGSQVMNDGLNREWTGLFPSAAVRQASAGRPLRPPAKPVSPGRPRSAARSRPPSAFGGRPPMAAPPVPATRAKPARSRPARQPGDLLAPDATVTFASETARAGLDDLFASLNDQLIGLAPVKERVAEIGSLLLVDRARRRFGLTAPRPNLHMCFTGAPGTGKTTVALMMADLLHRLGYLDSGHIVHAMRDDLVGQYIGQTAPKTKHVLDRAMGGVLFIDEAYSLFRDDDSRDYGQECVDILLQVMENQRDSLVVILAGYKDRMDRFFESNPGMRSRVAHHLDFAAYRTGELLAIGKLMLDRSSYYLSAEATAALRDSLAAQAAHSHFANARSVRNALESARLRHAHRLAAEPERPWSRDDLMRLEPSDILPGPVLSGPGPL
jgi:probable Rubsico expression protein CbbX